MACYAATSAGPLPLRSGSARRQSRKRAAQAAAASEQGDQLDGTASSRGCGSCGRAALAATELQWLQRLVEPNQPSSSWLLCLFMPPFAAMLRSSRDSQRRRPPHTACLRASTRRGTAGTSAAAPRLLDSVPATQQPTGVPGAVLEGVHLLQAATSRGRAAASRTRRLFRRAVRWRARRSTCCAESERAAASSALLSLHFPQLGIPQVREAWVEGQSQSSVGRFVGSGCRRHSLVGL